jgi:signal transduction histidine kinase
MKQLIFLLFLIPVLLTAQEPVPSNLSKWLKKGVFNLSDDWKYKAGDNPEWANPDFDDSSWETFTDANLYNKKIRKKAKQTNIIWFRKRIIIDSTTTQKLVLNVFQSGASEIYLDGELIHSLGKVSSNPDSVVRYNPVNVPLAFPMEINKEQVLAVRFSDSKKKFSLFPEVSGLNILVQEDISAKDYLFVANDSLFSDYGIIDLGFRNGWRFHPGDNMAWAKPDFDDSDWMLYLPPMMVEPIPDSLWNGYGWFRYRFAVDSSVYSKVTNLYFSTYGAAEVYLDGKLVQKYGVFSTDAQEEKYYNPYYKLHPAMVLQQAGSHVLAVRFSYHKGQQYKKLLGKYARTFGFSTGLATDDLNKRIFSSVIFARQYFFTLGTILLLIVFLHGFFFLLLPAERSNFYIAIVAFLLLLHISVTNPAVFVELDVLQFMLFKQIPYIVIFLAAVSMFPLTINSMFNHKPRLMHRMLICSFPFVALANFIFSGPDINVIVGVVYCLVILFFSSQVLIQAWRNKQKGVLFVAGGFLGLIAITIAWIIYSRFSQNYSGSIANGLAYSIYIIIPLGLTAFMAVRFRDLYRNLEEKVAERTRALKQSLEELKSTQTQLIQSEKMASLGQLTAGIAHEIQNPLNFVNNFSEINKELIDELKEELAIGNSQSAEEIANDIKENEEKINHHGKRAESIVKGMLLHSRGSSGHKEPTDINALAMKTSSTKSSNPFSQPNPPDREPVWGFRLAYDIVKAHGGEINVESSENNGTEFTIQLPEFNPNPVN